MNVSVQYRAGKDYNREDVLKVCRAIESGALTSADMNRQWRKDPKGWLRAWKLSLIHI